MSFYYDYEICKVCQGKCCKALPGSYTPEDITRLYPASTLEESVMLAINSGIISIDWWEAYKPLPFLRPQTKNNIHGIYDPSFGGHCIHLAEKGCVLTEDKRPYFCKVIKPNLDSKKCNSVPSKQNLKYESALLWQKTGINLFKWRGDVT